MNDPKVTVLITVKNNVSTMKQCIDSLLEQDYDNYDIMVVDAFSNDGTYEILQSYGDKIRLFQLKGWAPTAYNWALDKIDSDFVALTDADCVIDKSWIKELINGFISDDIHAVAGYCSTPETKGLSRIIGIELEDRFKKFPKLIARAPTMNLCIRTNVLKELKFDEKMRVGYDTDFGYRLNENGKMAYNNRAIIYHHHRATWKNLFKQQYNYAKYAPTIYFKKHKSKITGDFISKPTMMFQIVLTYILLASLIGGFFINGLFILSATAVLLILLIWFVDILRMTRSVVDVFWFLALFFVRLVAWTVGIFTGLIYYMTNL